ncbi:hypothetical protein ILUMI_18115 [Ignelater luminosus]|uniref:Uncharacterized protein n=1 Tax=Ignelater luminosus TaxID=2038154 RepID=A0A8K0G6P9_IGNLU|nr:hypothetical protein ILUMI_18115 [Ignelater luminosus]
MTAKQINHGKQSMLLYLRLADLLVCLQEERLGRRIVDIQHLLYQLRILDSHDSKYNCSFKNLNFIREKRLGLSYVPK